MKPGIKIHPALRYDAVLCGLRGDSLTLPGQAIIDMARSGDATEAVSHWAKKIHRPKTLIPSRLRAILRETGAWSEGDLSDDDVNWDRAVGIAACNASESAREGDAFVLEPETEDEVHALVEAFVGSEDGETLVGDVAQLVFDRIGEGLTDDEFEELFETGQLACAEDVWKALGEDAFWDKFESWVGARIGDLVSDCEPPALSEFFRINGSTVTPDPEAIAKRIDIAHEDLNPIVFKAAEEAFKQRRRNDIRKLCRYLGVPHVAERAASMDMDRVPKILELANR